MQTNVNKRGSVDGRWSAGGGLLAALFASTCCVLPLVLVTVGLSGAWIGSLTALEPYQPLFTAIAAGLLVWAFWQIYRRPRADCDPCQTRKPGWVVKSMLATATVLLLSSATVDWWAPLLY